MCIRDRFEAGADDFCDKIIAVLAPHDTRVARIIERDGLSDEAARARIDAQPNDMFYREKCDFIIENNGDLDMLYRDTDALYSQLIKCCLLYTSRASGEACRVYREAHCAYEGH